MTAGCLYSNVLLGEGDTSRVDVTGIRAGGANARKLRSQPGPTVRILHAYDALLDRVQSVARIPAPAEPRG